MRIEVGQIAEGRDDDVRRAAASMMDALAGFDDRSDVELLERIVPMLRRQLDALEGEMARLTVALQSVSCRPETGVRSVTNWVARCAGCAPRRVTASLHLGRDLADHPAIAAELRGAAMSVDNAGILAEFAGLAAFTAAADELFAAARVQTPGRLRHTIDRWLSTIPAEHDGAAGPGDRDDVPGDRESELEHRRRRAYERRYLRAVPVSHGMVRIEARLPTEVARAVMARLAEVAGMSGEDDTGRSWPQRLSDALVELSAVDGAAWSLVNGVSPQMTIRPTMVGVAPDDVVARRRYGGGVSSNGDVLDAADLSEMECSADRWQLHHDARGAPLDMDRRRRLFTRQQYLAMVERDGGCRVGGCEAPAERCQTHHVDDHGQGGETVLARGALVCATHHRWLHHSGARFLGKADGDMWIETSDGRLFAANPPLGGIPAGPCTPRREGIAIVFAAAS